jgi:hypothetical protein
MKVFSASQAVWPAVQRTYRYLFRPFAWETFLKLAAVATITEGMVVSFRFSAADSPSFDNLPVVSLSSLLAPEYISFTVLAVLVAVFTCFLAYYLAIHLRFVFFHCLVHESKEIRPVWALYQVPALRLFKASLLVWLTFLLMGILTLGVVAIAFFALFTLRTPDGRLDLGNFFILFTPCAGIALLLCLAGVIAEVVLRDFILPHMALENATFHEAWMAVRQRIATHRETFLSYFILRLGLPLIAGVMVAVAGWVVGRIVFATLGMSATGFEAMLDDATGVGAYFRIGLQVLFVLLGLGIGSVLAVSLGGPLGVYARNYALLFYGGHYRALGEALDPAPPGRQN